jgi:translation initiation factor 2B subunit (eIF-2B alpha/beta/delta family)
VLRDGAVVNKVGTRGLALAAADGRKPFYVACETLKFDARYDAASWPGSPPQHEKQISEAAGERAGGIGNLFEVTPGSLVTLVVTERGTYAPDVVRMMLSAGRARGRTTTEDSRPR